MYIASSYMYTFTDIARVLASLLLKTSCLNMYMLYNVHDVPVLRDI